MVWILFVFAILMAGGYTINSFSVAKGAADGKLAACPQKSNCVCSQDSNAKYFIEPFFAKGIRPMERLLAVVQAMPRTHIVEQTSHYLHVTFRSQVFQFIDDVEFLYIPEEQKIHARSASRLGYYDFGVNRDRIEKVRAEFENPVH